MSDVLIVIDMQQASMETPRFEVPALVERLNALAAWVRAHDGLVIWVQHEDDGTYRPGSEGWKMLPSLNVEPADVAVGKTACDGFLGTKLEAVLRSRDFSRVILSGCATDFCVDTTVRRAAGLGFNTWVPSDGHTTADRPPLTAEQVIAHHNFVWSEFIAPGGPVKVMPCREAMAES